MGVRRLTDSSFNSESNLESESPLEEDRKRRVDKTDLKQEKESERGAVQARYRCTRGTVSYHNRD